MTVSYTHLDVYKRQLEFNYGVGTPTAVNFTPLIKKHIDVLVGKYLELEPRCV